MVLGEVFCEGKTKILYNVKDDDRILVQRFKDDVTANNGKKHEVMKKKGFYCNQISSKVFEKLESVSVPTHYISRYNDNSMVIKKTKPIPLEVVIRKYPAGSLVKRLDLKNVNRVAFKQGGSAWVTFQETPNKFVEGEITELYLKDDDLGDPLINDDHAGAYVTDRQTLGIIKNYAYVAYQQVRDFFHSIGLTIMDVKFEFGKDANNKIVLIDDISPEGCRLKDWHMKNHGSGPCRFDKDSFRYHKNNFVDELEEVYNRIVKVLVMGQSLPNRDPF